MKIKSSHIAITVVCFVIGFAITLQIKSVWRINSLDSTKALRTEDLISALMQERQKNDSLTTELNSYKNDLEQFKTQASESSGYSKLLSEQLQKAELAAGITDMQGPGIVVKMTDSKLRNDPTNPTSANAEVIHDSDLLMLINELRASEAEAISLNGQRVIATSEIRCAGPSVSINNVRCYAPFEISAIGDFDKINSSLNMPEGFADTMKFFNIQFEIKKVDKVRINGFAGTINNKFATPVAAAAVNKEGGE